MSEPSRWTEIKVDVPLGWQELVADALGHALCTTVQIGDHSIAHEAPPDGFVHLRSYVPTTQDTPEFRSELVGQLEKLAKVTEAAELNGMQPRYLPLPPEDYANSWKKSWKPFRLRRGNRALRIEPPWNEMKCGPKEVPLVLEPGGAFGSGRHATTRTCLAVALERIRGEETVLDAGTGSGILAVTSVLLGAAHAEGFDIDPISTQSAKDLATQNGVADSIHFFTASLEEMPKGPFDVVFANIYSDVIVEHADRLSQVLDTKGWFAFSGCPAHHRDKTRFAIEKAGLIIQEDRQRGRWHTFVGCKRPN